MSDAGESGDVERGCVEDENKVKIEATTVNLSCVKNEPNERLDFEDHSHTTQYRITLEYENIFGEPSHQLKIEDSDNLIGFLDNDVIMVKEEDYGCLNNFDCSKCKGIYNGYCLKCSTLLHILNNNSTFVNSESELNTMPTDILEIRETSRGKGVYLLRTLPINIIFGPFEGILGIESAVGHSWKIIDDKLSNIKSGNWMKNIVCAASASLRNLDIFQIDGNLYFQTNREIVGGEELLIYYKDEESQQLDNSEECLYTPRKQEKLPKIFACTVCCLGFGSNKCLMEHKGKCRVEHTRGRKGSSASEDIYVMNHCQFTADSFLSKKYLRLYGSKFEFITDFVLVECHYCKMWMEKWEHEEHHVAYCLEKHHRMSTEYSEEMEGDCGTRAGKRRYQRDICSRPKDRRDDLQFDTKDYQCLSIGNHETRLNDYTLPERSNEKLQNTIETNNKSRLQNLLNKHRDIKPFKCDICLMKYTRKDRLTNHIKNKHTDNGNAKDYKCLQCSYETNDRRCYQNHLNKHKGIKAFQCEICMKKFTLKGSLKKHIKNKHARDGSSKDYQCPECSFETNYKHHYQAHLNKHRGIRPFQCEICMKKFTEKGYLTAHIKNTHADDATDKDYQCSECSYETNDRRCYQNHLNKHKGIKAFQCEICMKKFTLKGSLKKHIRNKHASDGSSKDYQCPECSYQTNYKRYYQAHLNKHRGIRPFQCDICMKTFTRKDYLKTHIKNTHAADATDKDYQCLECSYETNDRRCYQNHLNKHKGIKAFQCDICMKTFTEKGSLKKHIKDKHAVDGGDKDYKCAECSYQTICKRNFQHHLNKHMGIKPFECDICMKKFSLKGSLSKHIKNAHADDGGVRDYKCSECNYQTNYKDNFQRHENKHKGIKPFECDICLMKFTQKGSLKTHIKNQHTDDGSSKVYQCSECNYQTNYRNSLQRHQNMHRGIKPFECDICLMKFAQKGSLNTHIKNKHADDGSSKVYKCSECCYQTNDKGCFPEASK